jgi:general secretion pathway protein A
MYRSYYGLREKPFAITPDPGFLYLSANHREAFAHLLYGIDNHVGFIELTGEVGAGKTTVIRTLLDQLDREKYRTAIILNPCISSLGLMQSINREYALSADLADTAGLLEELNRFLLAENAAGRTVVLVIDEAQNLEPTVLEQVRLISNLETERDKLIQIVLVGQPELRPLLRRPELRQLGQRLAVSYHLRPMDFGDSRDYVSHRIEVAGGRDRELFTTGALRRIYRFSGGLPRLINLACDRALLAGYTRERTPVTARLATLAIADLRREEPRRLPRFVPVLLVLAVSATLLAFALGRTPQSQPAPATAPAADLGAALPRELGGETEEESARRAVNALAPLWGVAPLSAPVKGAPPEGLVRQRGLEFAPFSGPLGRLLGFNTPAILELRPAGIAGRRYLAITAAAGDRLTIAPPLAGRGSLTTAEVERIWSGRAILTWKNYLDLPVNLRPGGRAEAVGRLQGLLRGAGAYTGPQNGRFGRDTVAALRTFQEARGVTANGTLDRQTLLLLYRDGGGFFPPRLFRKGER